MEVTPEKLRAHRRHRPTVAPRWSSPSFPRPPERTDKRWRRGSDGSIWFVVDNNVVRLTPQTGTTVRYPVTSGTPAEIARGPDGNVWFTVGYPPKIGRISADGTMAEFGVEESPNGRYAYSITGGRDGAMWFTLRERTVGRISTSGAVSLFPGGAQPNRIVTGPDGNVWFTQISGNKIGRLTTAGTLTEFPIDTNQVVWLDRITAGPDGHLWFTASRGTSVRRMSVTGAVKSFEVGEPTRGLTFDPDGNLWFATQKRLCVLSRSETLTCFDGLMDTPQNMLWGRDGGLWFVGSAGSVRRVTVHR